MTTQSVLSGLPQSIVTFFHKLIKELPQLLIHLLIIPCAHLFNGADEALAFSFRQFLFGVLNKPFYSISRKFHMALKTIDEITVLYDLSRAALACGENCRLVG